MAEPANLTWRRVLVALCFDPRTGELRDPIALLQTVEAAPAMRQALNAVLSAPLDAHTADLVKRALEGPSVFALDEEEVVRCPCCGLPGYLASVGGGR